MSGLSEAVPNTSVRGMRFSSPFSLMVRGG
jgi:hypothetical protein